MVKIKELFNFQRLIYKRCLKADYSKKADKLLVSWLMTVIFIRFLANTGFAVSTLLDGKLSVGISLTEFNMFHLLLLWILIPSVITGIAGVKSFLPSLCIRFPISKRKIFFSGLFGILYQPVFWVLGIVSLIGFIPLFFIQNNLFWLFTGLFYLCFCICFSIFLCFIFLVISNKAKFAGILSPLFKIILCLLLFANPSFYWGGDVIGLIFNKVFTLFSQQGNPSIFSFLAFLRPSTYLLSTGFILESIVIIITLIFAAILCLVFSYFISQKIAAFPKNDYRNIVDLNLLSIFKKLNRNKNISLLSKEIISLLNTIEVKMTMIIAFTMIIYLIQTPEVNQTLFGFVIALIFIIHASFYFNIFGFDKSSVNRYRLFPVSSNLIFASKNKSAILISCIHIIPLFIINLVKSQNIILCIYFFLIFKTITLLYCIIGNIASIILPQKRLHSHFGNTEDSNSSTTITATFCWGFILYVHNLIDGNIKTGIFIYICFIIVLFTIFLVLTRKIGPLFEERKEKMWENLM